MDGPFYFNPESARTFLINLRALSRMPLTAENLAQKFGPQSELAPKTVSALANALEYWGNQTHIRTFSMSGKEYSGLFTASNLMMAIKEKKLRHFLLFTMWAKLLIFRNFYFAFILILLF